MIQIRAFEKDDLPDICEIEQRSFPDPWPQEAFAFTHSYISFVIIKDGSIIGYSINIAALDEGMIANFAIDPLQRRQGYAMQLLKHTMKEFKNIGIKKVYLDVRPSNTAARALYEKYGFQYLGRRPGYYHNPPEDALVMSWTEETDERL